MSMLVYDTTETSAPESGGVSDTPRPTAWRDRFVMVHANVLGHLNPAQLVELVRLKRMEDVVHRDICQKVTRLTEVTGLKRDTLRRHLDPTRTSTRAPGVLSPWLRLRTQVITHPGAPGTPPRTEEVLVHQWENDLDGEEQWRIDVTPVRFVDNGQGERGLLSPEDRFIKVPYWWLWEQPSEAGADSWTPRRYPMRPETKSKARPAERDALTEAVFGAFVVAATPAGRYGISGLATVAGVSAAQMSVYLQAAEHAGLISVRHRPGRQAIRRAVKAPRL